MVVTRPTFLALAFVALTLGCTSHKDLTHTPEVQRSGILGKQFRTTQPLVLVKDKSSKTLQLVKSDYAENHGDGERIGPVPAETPLTIVRVVRVSELVAFMGPLPVHHLWTATLARIDTGPYSGREVTVDGRPLSDSASVHNDLLRPVR